VLGALTLVGALVVYYEFSSAPPAVPEAPVILAVKPPPKIPGKIPAPVPDGNGVVRVSSPAESARAAAYTLAGLLKRPPPDPVEFEKVLDAASPSPNFVAAGKILGLDARLGEVQEAIRNNGPPMILPLKREPDAIGTAPSLERRLDGKVVSPGMLAGSRKHYVVVKEVRGSDAVILDPLAGLVVIPVRDLVKQVEGKGVVWVLPQKK
jgi:hypothetical protein